RVRAALASVDSRIPLNEVVMMDERVHESITEPRHLTALLGGFAAAAVALAAVGIFGMLSYTVSARRREIGVRMALGATEGVVVVGMLSYTLSARRRVFGVRMALGATEGVVVGMIVRRGMVHAIVGAALGLVAALAGTRWLASALFDVGATDPLTLAVVTLLL